MGASQHAARWLSRAEQERRLRYSKKHSTLTGASTCVCECVLSSITNSISTCTFSLRCQRRCCAAAAATWQTTPSEAKLASFLFVPQHLLKLARHATSQLRERAREQGDERARGEERARRGEREVFVFVLRTRVRQYQHLLWRCPQLQADAAAQHKCCQRRLRRCGLRPDATSLM